MTNPSKSRIAKLGTALVVCLGFTGSHVAWADDALFPFDPVDPVPSKIDTALGGPPRSDLYVEDPCAPHETSGSEARLGTVVGYVYGEPDTVLAIGASVAGGYRFGRLTLESELTMLKLRGHGTIMTPIGPADGDIDIGRGERLSAIARYDVIRLDSHVVGANSMMSIYVEGGLGTAWNHWTQPAYNETLRTVPNDTKQVEGQFGFGVTLDHRLQEPIGFPRRIAWFLGWRMALAPHEAMTGTLCRGITCNIVTSKDDTSTNYVDRSMLFQSSLQFTF